MKSLNENQIKDLYDIIEEHFVTSDESIGRSWLAPNGIFISNLSLYDDIYEGEPNHSTLLDWLYENGYIESESYRELENLGYIRLSNWDTAIILTELKPTDKQYDSIAKWLYAENLNKVMIDTPTDFQWYTLYEDNVDIKYIINRIKRYYSSGKLYEDLENDLSDEYDSEGNRLTKQQVEFFRNSKVRDDIGRLLVCYHGSYYKDFDSFIDDNGLIWFTDDIDYSYNYGSEIRTCYLNLTNPLDLGDINLEFYEDYENKVLYPEVVEFSERVGISTTLLEEIYEQYEDLNDNMLYNVTRRKEFKDFCISKGYDGVIALESYSMSYGCINSNQIKSITNKKPTKKENINESIDKKDLFIFPKSQEAIDNYWADENAKVEIVPIDKLVKDNGLLNDKDLESYHGAYWDYKPATEFSIDKSKVNEMDLGEVPYVTRKFGKLVIGDGRHRIRALYNDGYKYVQLPVRNDNLNESSDIFYWNSLKSIHYPVEQEIKRRYDNVKVNQNKMFDLEENLKKLQYDDVFITDSPYDIFNLITNKPKEYRIVYDANIDKYMICEADVMIHNDMIETAMNNYYYTNNNKVNEVLNAVSSNYDGSLRELLLSQYNYFDAGTDGYYDEETGETIIEPYLVYMTYVPKDKDNQWVKDDGYDKEYKNKYGSIWTRDTNLEDCDLYNLWFKPQNIIEDTYYSKAKAEGDLKENYDDFDNLTEKDILEAIEIMGNTYEENYIYNDFNSGNAFLVSPNGTIICIDSRETHKEFVESIMNFLDDFDIKTTGYNDVLDYFINELGFITLNGGDGFSEERCKIVIDKRPTRIQYSQIEKWLEKIFKAKEDLIVYCNGMTRYYNLEDLEPKDIIKKIQKSFVSGILEQLDIDNEMSNEYDSEGNQLTKAQAEFFKNSKVRNEQGRLLVCYHGTPEEFDTFNIKKVGDYNIFGKGFYFTSNEKIGKAYLGGILNHISDKSHVKVVYLNIKNPFNMNARASDSFLNDIRTLIEEDTDEDGWVDKFWWKNKPYDWGKLPTQWQDGVKKELFNEKDLMELKKYFAKHDDDFKGDFLTNYDVFYALVESIRAKAAFIDYLKSKRFDGITFNTFGSGLNNSLDSENQTIIVAFKPNQIKSITNKNPTNSDNVNEKLDIVKDDNNYVDYYTIFDNSNNEVGEFRINSENKDYLDAIEIYDKYQNKGYGTEILKRLIKDYNIKRLDVDRYNLGAQRLYKRVGFVKVATIYGNVNGDGNDRFIMEYKGNPNNYTIYYQDTYGDYESYSKLGWLDNGKCNLNSNSNLWDEVKELNIDKNSIKEELLENNKIGLDEDYILESKQDTLNFKNWLMTATDNYYNDTFGDFTNDDRKDFANDMFDWFEKNRTFLKSPQNDYYYWINLKDNIKAIEDLTNLKKDKETTQMNKQKVKEGAKLLYSDSDWYVYPSSLRRHFTSVK